MNISRRKTLKAFTFLLILVSSPFSINFYKNQKSTPNVKNGGWLLSKNDK